MKYKIRKRQNRTLYGGGGIIEFNDEDFRKLKEKPYTGNSEVEFLEYISHILDEPPLELDSSVVKQLLSVGRDAEMYTIGHSPEQEQHTWLESGEIDDGEDFIVRLTTYKEQNEEQNEEKNNRI